jgi:hypothetical protein
MADPRDNEQRPLAFNFRVPRVSIDPELMARLRANSQRIAERLMSDEFRASLVRFGELSEAMSANLAGGTLSRSRDFEEVDLEPESYSTELRSAADYFRRDEVVISSFDELHRALGVLFEKTPGLRLVWRGVRSASWGMHSNLFRLLCEVNGVKFPAEGKPVPRGPQPFPDEDQMVRAERVILATARDLWRFDEVSALELFARLQHYGAPTRLLDVSRNPYIAAWFAVEHDPQTDDLDARLFALSTTPVGRANSDEVPPDTQVRLDELGALRDPFWHYLTDTKTRQEADWGTGARRRVWVPPSYEQRIVAQDAGFVLDGVPMTSARTAPYFKRDSSSEYWRKPDLLASASIYAKTAKATRSPQPNQPNFAPTFTFRITAEAKAEVRRVLEQRFSYSAATLYPDMAALGGFLRDNLAALMSE